jgi:subtilisin-like proprotein convertase family protein
MRALSIAKLRRTTGLLLGSASFILILALLSAGVGTTLRPAHAQDAQDAPQTVFTNATSITINDADVATPYPSDITVSGLGTSIPATAGSVQVTLNSFSHTFPDDVGILLVGPTGAALLIQDGAGDDPDMVNVTYTLSDTGATVLPDTTAWTAGTYKPTAYFTGDPFPSPGPGTTYSNPGPAGGNTATFSSVFGGTNPNGVWHLYVEDFTGGDSGTISGGWSLTINAGGGITPQHVRDFDNDGKTDFAVFRPNGNVWYIHRSSDNVLQSMQFGLSTDVLVEADYDGDHKTDIAVFRDGVWYLQRTTAGFTAVQFGQQGDIPVPADYDGDGKADIAVWRAGQPFNSFFYILQSTTGNLRIDTFGQNGDKPVPGDYDGDGKADPAVYRNGTAQNPQSFWYYRASTGPLSGQIIGSQWGTTGDKAVPGDYDGDGKLDNAVFRPSTSVWYILHSNTGGITAQKWGQAEDKVVQGDYDGDGKTDIAVWRDSNGVFYTIDSSTGQPFASDSNETNRVQKFGQSGDDALAYVPEQ